ncbi:xanthine dehydrogenase family protein molybdopterin-binding subunit [Colwellia sp. MB3u-55]|uniref:xanthine dehydrogenase family protein molybdopterin-binding subunit n=1 Tax=Colwellia sp. MB3u-55 TaxID=2759810 RepID=UPI0015F5776A|nr:molybdopterin cofactor-binding domain-containing protein [Colwellia sp. MB3u-55]MBA6251847.1 xanthine dehydrogenase family protein molybdopterin-binding subunit [Colwellia sp. MB3u-55]
MTMQNIKDAKNNVSLSRRRFLVGTVSSTLLMAFAPLASAANIGQSPQETLKNKLFSPTVWFEINPQGDVNINIAKAEMGQHIGTALARVVADELGADWSKVFITHVDTDPKWGYMVTGGSWSVFQTFKPLSQAGAAGRIALIEAAAKIFNCPAEQCRVENGAVIYQEQSLSFGEVVTQGTFNRVFTPKEIDALPLKPASKRTLVGKPSLALDIPDKTNGSAVYGIDVELEGMVYARPIVPPTRYGTKVTNVDDSAAKKVKGYLGYHILQDPSENIQGWVSVEADTYYGAIKAGDALKVSYQAGKTAKVSEQDIIKEGERLVADENEGGLFINDGDFSAASAKADKSINAVYRTHTALHFALEPVNATVEEKNGLWHVYTGNQWQSLTLPAIAKALQVSDENVVMHQQYLGGGFGRRLFGDYAIPAVLTAKAIGKPVKMVFTREDDSRFDQPRSPSVVSFQALFDQKNKFTGMQHALAAGWPTLSMAPGFMPESLDKKIRVDMFSTSGADHWYSMENHRVRVANNSLAQQTMLPGWLRSVGQGWIVWGLESFIDEIAHQSKMDPIDFRLSMLDGLGKQAGKAPESVGGAKRLAHVLTRLKEKTANVKLGKNEAIGVAISAGQERTMPAWMACAAQVHVEPSSGKITVKKLTMIADAGVIIHPDGALAQVQGSMLWGTSLALHEQSPIENGQVSNINLNTYTPLRMNDVPELDIEFVESEEFPVGLGEPGVVSIAPAIANAIFQITGVRVRDLPIKSAALVST